MTYRPPSHVPETRWARHLDAVMRDRGWSRVRLFEEVGAELGYAPKSRSGFLPLLIDRDPTPAQADVLRRHFGEPPEEAAPVAGPGRGDTVPGLADLVAAISSLVAAIEQDRQERTATRKLVEENRQKIDEQDQSIGQLTERLRLVEAQLEATGSDAPGGSGGLVAAGRA